MVCSILFIHTYFNSFQNLFIHSSNRITILLEAVQDVRLDDFDNSLLFKLLVSY